MTDSVIIGAGLAGLITACKIKDVPIMESGERIEQHKALLRFRDKSVSELTGIPFQEVTVHKEIHAGNTPHHRCTIAMANMYARKVSGRLQGRSIWNLDTVKRYVAPMDFYDQLVDRLEDRIHWQTPLMKLSSLAEKGPYQQVISTIPMPVMMRACGMEPAGFEFSKSEIHVARYKLPKGSAIYQTVYYPEPDLRVFRASITGDLLIVESMTGQPADVFTWRKDSIGELNMVASHFGLHRDDLVELDAVDQKYGKIVELPREQREAVLYELTRDFGVFSIGRFATWRNILLDDVAKDIEMVEKLIKASTYGRGLVMAKN